jgi:L-arabinose isomerase
MIDFTKLELWFVTGSQHLYGPETLKTVSSHAQTVARGLSQSSKIPVQIVSRPIVTTQEEITAVCREANASLNCIGLIAWMHTFSPAKMWVQGLRSLNKPLLHLHTQFNRELPWSTIDMDFMNLNQSAHGDREFGYICSRLRLNRKVVVGFWQDESIAEEIGVWSRAAAAWHDSQNLKVARFGDNMREVAVTEGDKVGAQSEFGYSVNGFGIGDLAKVVDAVGDSETDKLIDEYEDSYTVVAPLQQGGEKRQSLYDAARIEIGLRQFLTGGSFLAFTDSFQILHGLKQLPGVAVQRLMADGFGFGAEGDWKTAALLRSMKVMSQGLQGGTSFMEDYTYDLGPRGLVLGAHMLEVCPSIAASKPSLEIHPLSIGGKEDPVRLVFTAPAGPALNASIVDMGGRFRMIVSEVDVVEPDQPMPRLPVARALWIPRPNLKVGTSAWIHAGGAHHTGFSQALTTEHLEDFANIIGIELLVIDADTKLRDFQNELRWNGAAYLKHAR